MTTSKEKAKLMGLALLSFGRQAISGAGIVKESLNHVGIRVMTEHKVFNHSIVKKAKNVGQNSQDNRNNGSNC